MLVSRINTAREASTAMQKRIEQLVSTQDDKRAMAIIGARRAAVLSALKEAQALKANDPGGVLAFVESKFAAAVADFEQAQQALIDLQLVQREAARADAADALMQTLWTGVAAAITVCTLGLFAAALLMKRPPNFSRLLPAWRNSPAMWRNQPTQYSRRACSQAQRRTPPRAVIRWARRSCTAWTKYLRLRRRSTTSLA